MTLRGALRSVRGAIQRAHGLPGVGAVLGAAHRRVWERTILRAGVVDADYYAAQRGWESASPGRAVRDYLARGFAEGLSLHPLVDEVTTGRRLPGFPRVPALYAFLAAGGQGVSSHPWWRPGASTPTPELLRRYLLGLEPMVRLEIAGAEVDVPWSDYRAAVRAAVAADARDDEIPGGDMVRMAVGRRELHVAERIRRALEITAVGLGAVIVAASPAERALAAGARLAHPDLALRRSGGGAVSGVVLDLESSVSVDAGSALALVEEARSGRIAGPLIVGPDGALESAGYALDADGTRVPVLGGLPVADGARLGSAPIPVDYPGSAALAQAAEGRARGAVLVPTAIARRLREMPDDMRAGAEPEEPSAIRDVGAGDRGVVDAFAAAGLDVIGWRGAHPVLSRRDSVPRWSLVVSSPSGTAGAVWGDTHFAIGLASALRRSGIEVAIDAYDARGRNGRELDDVTLVVRGPYRVRPPRTGVRILWIISHPDQITAEELDDFDLVFAASETWADEASRRFGVRIDPLMEATDTDRFHPSGLIRGTDVVFVGTARGIARPAVVEPIRAGIPLRLYGPDWHAFVPGAAIAAPAIDNDDLPALYESASIVLNDHWPAMRKAGFLAMRPFDAVAAGGRVISDDVAGIHEIFGGAVAVYRDVDDLLRMLRADPDELFPPEDELRAIAQRVRDEHSFDARAATLVAAASRTSGG